MNTEQKYKTMIKRLENLSATDLHDLEIVAHHHDARIVRDRAYIDDAFTACPDTAERTVEWYWKNNTPTYKNIFS